MAVVFSTNNGYFCDNIYTMSIKNPYPLAERHSFKRSFLHQTEVTMKFAPALTDVEFRERITPYLKSIFNLDLTVKGDPDANHAEVNSDQEQKKFIFDLDQARFIIGADSYTTFSETAIPMIGMMLRYINDVAQTEIIERLSIIKLNIWPIKSDDAYANLSNIIDFGFKEERVARMEPYMPDGDYAHNGLQKNSILKIADNASLETVISAEVTSDEMVHLELAINATATNITANDIISDAITLNDVIYHDFTETVSDNILNIMLREEL